VSNQIAIVGSMSLASSKLPAVMHNTLQVLAKSGAPHSAQNSRFTSRPLSATTE
jgi:hypothetical protein